MRVWDVDVRRVFEHAGRRFELSSSFASDARRLVLIGPSGAGKSQTLKIIAGLTRADAGHVKVQGRVLLDRGAGVEVPARARGLAYVFQDYALFPHLTVLQNIAFGLNREGVRGWRNPSRRTEHPEVARWIEAFGLQPLAHHYPEQLSGGQRQRTALARALVARPQALLLDEPFAALDSALRARLRDELADLQAQLQLPMLLITHDEADAERLADQVLTMEEGRILAAAPPPCLHVCSGAPQSRDDHGDARPIPQVLADRP
ncbi:ATP-binding cassette domain-containing protein [Roseateles sp. DAIF2]|uniref:ABC transporter ATP-binding protein n=1 Tax=Roseateles sp. DAIF2 TaxID=2714952 RepID=UPI0018A2C82D|nr:ATP-binding cassette domain-containing protein [Roseateles sp. DAIF2]QPF74785.1 ATP-binding cassette domain-containing protein [Roseateles sp. DAIF2]